jgi:hypothetical protein
MAESVDGTKTGDDDTLGGREVFHVRLKNEGAENKKGVLP